MAQQLPGQNRTDASWGRSDVEKGPLVPNQDLQESNEVHDSSQNADSETGGAVVEFANNPYLVDLEPDAPVWAIYRHEADRQDKEIWRELNEGLDTLLIFAGLFSAIITAFLIEIRKGLQEDLLQEILQQLQQTPPVEFVPTSQSLWVNGLWFTSLTLSLVSAICVILSKSWIRGYIKVTNTVPREVVRERQVRYDAYARWRLSAVIAAAPIPIHLSFFLFLIGMLILLSSDSPKIAFAVGSLVVSIGALYLGATFLPIIVSDSPFQTPLSTLLVYLHDYSMLRFSRGSLVTDAIAHASTPDLVDARALAWLLLIIKDQQKLQQVARAIAGLKGTRGQCTILCTNGSIDVLVKSIPHPPLSETHGTPDILSALYCATRELPDDVKESHSGILDLAVAICDVAGPSLCEAACLLANFIPSNLESRTSHTYAIQLALVVHGLTQHAPTMQQLYMVKDAAIQIRSGALKANRVGEWRKGREKAKERGKMAMTEAMDATEGRGRTAMTAVMGSAKRMSASAKDSAREIWRESWQGHWQEELTLLHATLQARNLAGPEGNEEAKRMGLERGDWPWETTRNMAQAAARAAVRKTMGELAKEEARKVAASATLAHQGGVWNVAAHPSWRMGWEVGWNAGEQVSRPPLWNGMADILDATWAAAADQLAKTDRGPETTDATMSTRWSRIWDQCWDENCDDASWLNIFHTSEWEKFISFDQAWERAWCNAWCHGWSLSWYKKEKSQGQDVPAVQEAIEVLGMEWSNWVECLDADKRI